MRQPRPVVSVIIPCRNERDHIARCLDSILAGDYPKHRMEILVVDGMSDDGTADIVREYATRDPAIQLLENPQRVVPSALNHGIRCARGQIVARADAHAEYPTNYLSGLLSWLVRSGADNVGGACLTLPANETAQARAIACALSHPFGVGNAHFRLGVKKPLRVDTVPFGCFRRALFTRVGLFDEELVRNQDDEFNLRLIKAGGSILLVPGITSHYRARGTLGQLARMSYQYGYFKPLVARKVGGIMTARQLIPGLFLSGVCVTALFAPWLSVARVLFAVAVGAYTAADLIVAGSIARREGLVVGLAASATFPVLHAAYGLGYLRGVFDFLIRGKRPDAAVSLSR